MPADLVASLRSLQKARIPPFLEARVRTPCAPEIHTSPCTRNERHLLLERIAIRSPRPWLVRHLASLTLRNAAHRASARVAAARSVMHASLQDRIQCDRRTRRYSRMTTSSGRNIFCVLVVRSSFPTTARLSVKPRRARSSIAPASVWSSVSVAMRGASPANAIKREPKRSHEDRTEHS